MAMNFDYDFSGYATKANTKCYDGLTIAPNAFADDNGRKVPVVWNHNHSGPEYVLGHALLQNRRDGVYAYVKMNDTPSGQTALEAVRSGDIDAMSIFANGLKKAGQTVMHGVIRELSLVLAGCNPGALIDEIVAHGADNDGEGGEAFIYTDGGLSLKHGLDPDDNPLNEEDDEMAKEGGKTLEEVVDTMNDEQKEALYALVGMAKDGLDEDDDPEEDDYDEDEDLYEDEDEEEDEPEHEAPPRREEPPRRAEPPRRRETPTYQEPPRRNPGGGKVVNIHATTQLQVVLVKPERYENASEVADHLRDKRTVVLNLEKTQKDVARRLLDFLSGVAYAQEGKIKKVALQTYIVTPYNVDIMGDLIDELENNGVYV